MYETIGSWLTRRAWHVQVVDIGKGLVGQSYRNIRTDKGSCSVFMLESGDSDAIENQILPYCDAMLGAEASGSPWSTLRWVNSRLHAIGPDATATACLGVCTASGVVRIAFAGYPCAYVQEHSKRVRRLIGGGAPLGLFHDVQYPEKVCLLERGEAAMFVNVSAEELVRTRHVGVSELFDTARFQETELPLALPQAATAIVVRRLDPAFAPSKHAHAQKRNFTSLTPSDRTKEQTLSPVRR